MFYLLAEKIAFLNFFKSIYLRGFLGFTLGFLIVLFAGKPFINFLKRKKFGEEIRQEGPSSHFSKKGTPTMGGVLIILSTLITTIFIGDLKNKFVILLMVITVLFSAIGFIDDYKKFTVNKKGLSGKKKLLGQGLIALITWGFILKYGLISGKRVLDLSLINPIMPQYTLYLGAFGMLIMIGLILMGTSNAVNITDGLDGLAIMPVVICASILGVIAYFSGHTELSSHLNLHYIVGAGEITVFLSILSGAGLGFLWYNFYPAQIFMGDTGSLTLGGILGVVAIVLKQELLLPVIGGVFVMEAVSVILQVGSFKLRGKRIFKMAPIHHHFELAGLPETKVTMRFWIIALILGIFALGLVRLRGIL
ncbi:MAG: phospho-N-acetylmuramoyl-pentapeptide-transferase [Cetobacterium sp.]|uniref:Phospho-N-acetylmuramoyl-pentapeptide-transferase n=1 Tax=Cetobacterium ceti TaxID=180163 RepID=A0A1T4P0F8_9FUSO|nr:phospho-N-acetylmuramoyl-pentapeptide-transferase [Cetobacterium ceti]MCJ8342379.1 phospho-N-acetylmuramoyl-pentapeptide-transferase [Cetobacterium sp.]SJZ85090.1 Phospho-N-acetylmuramoyl-pentapeptide-transferase [Cetobacterium ceti]